MSIGRFVECFLIFVVWMNVGCLCSLGEIFILVSKWEPGATNGFG